MPALDRRIIVRLSADVVNQFGETSTVTTDYPQWATRLDASVIDASTEGGEVTTSTRTFVVRWRREIAEALVSGLSVLEGAQTLNVLNVIEQASERDERRKFLRIEATGEVVI